MLSLRFALPSRGDAPTAEASSGELSHGQDRGDGESGATTGSSVAEDTSAAAAETTDGSTGASQGGAEAQGEDSSEADARRVWALGLGFGEWVSVRITAGRGGWRRGQVLLVEQGHYLYSLHKLEYLLWLFCLLFLFQKLVPALLKKFLLHLR